ncbi:methylmalonyl-CoA mutase family protein [Rhodoligotrophos defluvii]|uniref:methylmalonyl-CoA mutase family protein n=1 Tax=Rhodoligotrophos defluvii TaxID=2561934 RepID=UPI0010C95473|nr:methylmalonyl-CoA mutase family protein [Rhodoligotrophos defluvii]
MSGSFDQPDFPTPTRDDWLRRVEATLKGADYDKRLVWRTDDGIAVDPLGGPWTKVRPEWPGLPPFTRGASPIQPLPRPWTVAQPIMDPSPERANRALLEALANGVDSVDLMIAEDPHAPGIGVWRAEDLAIVLKDVVIGAVPVRLNAGIRALELAEWLIDLWSAGAVDKAERRGAFGIDPLGCLARRGSLPGTVNDHLGPAARLAAAVRGYADVQVMNADTRPYHAAGATEGQELAIALATGVAYLRGLTTAGLSLEQAVAVIGFTLVSDADVITSIAKLRAFRRLWANVTEACGLAAKPPRLAVETAARMITRRDPWVNMLRGTAAAFAAGIAGAELITVAPYNAALGLPDDFARRIARNVQLILQEESGIGRVADPAGGAWAIERLTDQLAEKGWALFQEIEARGGMAVALLSGHVQTMVHAAAVARTRDYARRKRLVTGVSAFPKLDEAAAQVAETSGQPAFEPGAPRFEGETKVDPLQPRPLAAEFEALRDQGDAIAADTGQRPQIFLANLGRLADFNTRTTWARNLFEAGGIAALPGRGCDNPQDVAREFQESGAKLAIICSSDAIYETMAAPTAKALKNAGACAVYLAGRPGDAEQTLKDPGLHGFFFEGADVLAGLRDVYDILSKSA